MIRNSLIASNIGLGARHLANFWKQAILKNHRIVKQLVLSLGNEVTYITLKTTRALSLGLYTLQHSIVLNANIFSPLVNIDVFLKMFLRIGLFVVLVMY